MKKSLIALAVLAASGAAMAQSSVTLYGVADAFVGSRKTNTVSVNTAGTGLVANQQRQTVIDSAGLSSTRWGLRVNEDLGGGMKAFATMEAGVNIDNGASQQAGLAFGRQAFVGLGGNFGAVSLGRQYSAYDDVKGSFLSAQGNSVSFDATGGTQANLAALSAAVTPAAAAAALNASTAAQASRIGAWVGYQVRVDNSIRYETPNISGFKGAVVYGFGENKNSVPNPGKATKNVSASLTYANGPVAVALAYADDQAANGTTSGFHIKNTGIGGNYDFGVAKAFLAFNRAKIDGLARQNEWSVGVKAPFGATTLVAQYARSKGDDLGKLQSFGLEAQYSLSKRTTAYTAFNQTKVFDNLAKNNVFGVGVRHTF